MASVWCHIHHEGGRGREPTNKLDLCYQMENDLKDHQTTLIWFQLFVTLLVTLDPCWLQPTAWCSNNISLWKLSAVTTHRQKEKSLLKAILVCLHHYDCKLYITSCTCKRSFAFLKINFLATWPLLILHIWAHRTQRCSTLNQTT